MKCKQLICAENIIIDSFSQTASAINILQEMNATLPIAYPITVLTTYEKDTENEPSSPEIFLEIKLNSIDLTSPIRLGITFREKVARHIINLGIVPISEPGMLEFIVKYEGQILNYQKINIRSNAPVQTEI